MKLKSREYQIQLRPERFAGGSESVQRFLDFVGELDERIHLYAGAREGERFEQIFHDTEGGGFAAVGVKLRTRIQGNGEVAATYKVVDPDRYHAAKAVMDSSHDGAEVKLEENIYAFHSMFTKQAKVKLPPGTILSTLGEWRRLFPGMPSIGSDHDILIADDRSFWVRLENMELRFSGKKADATLDLKYADRDHTHLDRVEFSWRRRNKDGQFRARTAKLMRTFFQTIQRSEWVDLCRDRRRCQEDAGLGNITLECSP